MNYKETVQYLFLQLPMFQKVGTSAFHYKLDKTLHIANLLGNPHHRLKFIHIAGTNGKGSVAHFLASILQEAGYKTGLYTSPHLYDFRERIKINGQMIGKEEVTNFVATYKSVLEPVQASFFEYSFGMALNHFASHKVDIVVLETGMGGRLDSTNIVTPLLSIITNIGMDHTAFLGNTLTQIAGEKAGIIKRNVPVIIGETQKETQGVFITAAKKNKSPLVFADQILEARNVKTTFEKDRFILRLDIYEKEESLYHISSKLAGDYQKKNIITTLVAARQLASSGFRLSGKNITEGIYNVVENTGIKGRWQVLASTPLVITDTAHNKEGLKIVVDQLKKLNYNTLHIIFGTVKDKDTDAVLALLPKDARYYFCKAGVPRAMDEKILSEKAENYNLKGTSFPSVISAYQQTLKSASAHDVIFVGGSTFVAGELLEYLERYSNSENKMSV